jgi:hypothetical protein
VLSIRIVILCILFCVSTGDFLPTLSGSMIRSYCDVLDDDDDDREQVPSENTESENGMLATNEEEDDDDPSKLETLSSDGRHAFDGRFDKLVFLVESIDFTFSFDDSFVIFQPLRV